MSNDLVTISTVPPVTVPQATNSTQQNLVTQNTVQVDTVQFNSDINTWDEFRAAADRATGHAEGSQFSATDVERLVRLAYNRRDRNGEIDNQWEKYILFRCLQSDEDQAKRASAIHTCLLMLNELNYVPEGINSSNLRTITQYFENRHDNLPGDYIRGTQRALGGDWAHLLHGGGNIGFMESGLLAPESHHVQAGIGITGSALAASLGTFALHNLWHYGGWIAGTAALAILATNAIDYANMNSYYEQFNERGVHIASEEWLESQLSNANLLLSDNESLVNPTEETNTEDPSTDEIDDEYDRSESENGDDSNPLIDRRGSYGT